MSASMKVLFFLFLVLGLCLWFCHVRRIMKMRQEAVAVADRQLQEAEDSRNLSDEAFSAVLARSTNIYHQAVAMYNQALRHPPNWLPAIIMGFRLISEDELRR